jgi:phage terminase small subunit
MALTEKQERFCQAYIRLGDKSAAYREAYDASSMKPESINRKAVELFDDGKITARVKELQDEVKSRNDVTVDEIVKTLSGMMRFDIADLYDSDGVLLPVHAMPKEARLMISSIDTDELFMGKMLIGQTKKIRLYSKLDGIEKLMKHLGGYEKDNKQRPAATIQVNLGSGIKPED